MIWWGKWCNFLLDYCEDYSKRLKAFDVAQYGDLGAYGTVIGVLLTSDISHLVCKSFHVYLILESQLGHLNSA